MKWMPKNPWVKNGIKGAIATGMVGAIGLPLYKLYVLDHGGILSPLMNTLVIIACVALVAHSIEGVIGGAIAYQRGENALKAALHAFFTGFVGLSEILNP